jgi:hypothetical protein
MDMLRGGFMPGLLGNGTSAGAGTSYAAESQLIFAAFTTSPTTARKNLIDACVVSLKSAGVWTKLDALYLYAAADSQAAKINWKAPGTFTCTEVNAPAFTADQGFTGASTQYLDSSFVASSAPTPKYVLNSASAFAWSLSDLIIGAPILGDDGSAVTVIFPKRAGAGNKFGIRVNKFFDISSTNVPGTAIGLFEVDCDAATVNGYINGALFYTVAQTPSGVPTTSLKLLRGAGLDWTGQIASSGFGSQFSAADNTALYNALRTYLTGVGVP